MKRFNKLRVWLITLAMLMILISCFGLTVSATEVTTQSVGVSAIDDVGSSALPGARFQIIDAQGDVVDEWISAEDDVETEDLNESIYKVMGLNADEVYTLKATVSPYGYILSGEIKFTVDKDGKVSSSGLVYTDKDGSAVLLMEFTKTKVRVLATYITDGTELPDVTIQLLDHMGNTVEEWVSELDLYEIEGLNIGEVFTLHTVAVPNGLTIPDDTTFSINEEGKVTYTGTTDTDRDGNDVMLVELAMTKVRIRTAHILDGTGLAGVTLQVCDVNGDVWEEWTSSVDDEATEDIDESVYEITGLKTKETYTLKASVIPDGYTHPAEMTFSISEDGKISYSGSITEEGVLLVEIAEGEPEITSFTFNSSSDAYDEQTNTFYYDDEHSLNILINGKNLKGQRIYLALFNSDVRHTFYLFTANHSTAIELSLKKQVLDSIIAGWVEFGSAPDIVTLRVHLYDIDGEKQYLPLNVMPSGYTVTFDYNGANIEATTMTTVDGKLEALPTPTRSRYNFKGWFDAEAGGNEITTDTVFTGDTTIYAQWSKKPSGGYSNTYTTFIKNEDGSTTKITKNILTGTRTEVTTKRDGSTITVETKREGTVTTTVKNKDGTMVNTVITADGETTAEVKTDTRVEIIIPVPDTEKVQMVVVTDEKGNKTYITEPQVKDNGIAVTIDKDVSISVMKGDKKEFGDVHGAGHWSEGSVDLLYFLGLMNGTGEHHFSPDAPLTRAMLVAVLYRLEGQPIVSGITSFADLEKGQYYLDAVCWAQLNGIVRGVSKTEFAPNDSITREQIAAIMHRYAEYKGYDVSIGENTTILSYDDSNSISEYAKGAMQYAVDSGLIKGKTETTLNPLDNATRAEAAAIIERFINAN